MSLADTRIIHYSGRTLCDNYRSPLSRCRNEAQALRLYKNCIGWALQERYPSKEELLDFTTKEVLAENGIYVDREFRGERVDDHVCCVFLGCRGTISTGLNVEKSIIPMLYLSEGSDLQLEVDGFLKSPVPVELYYGSRVSCEGGRIAVKDCNRLTASDNVGFSEEELGVDPDTSNEQL